MTSSTGLVYIDTNVFIYGVEGLSETAAPSRRLLEFLRGHKGRAVTSEIALAEVLAPPKRDDALPLHIKRRVYLDLIVWSWSFQLIPISLDILYETAPLRAVARLKLPDAIHLVTAIQRRCRFFVGGDHDFKHLPAGMTRVSPTFQDIDALLTEIA